MQRTLTWRTLSSPYYPLIPARANRLNAMRKPAPQVQTLLAASLSLVGLSIALHPTPGLLPTQSYNVD